MKKYLTYIMVSILLLINVIAVSASEIQDDFRLVQHFFPQADTVGELEGASLSAFVYSNNTIIGYVFYTDDVVKIPAYLGKPIRA